MRGIKIFICYPRNDIGNAEKIIKKCDDMKECLEIPFDKDIYKGSDKIDVRTSHHGSFQVEERRKTNAEKKIKEILKAFGELIKFCEEKEIYAEPEA